MTKQKYWNKMNKENLEKTILIEKEINELLDKIIKGE